MIEQWIFQMSSEDLVTRTLPRVLRRKGYTDITEDENFLYAQGDIPVLITSHTDTVHKKLPSRVYYDRKEGVMWAPEGLGADDRAGVAAILEILKRGYKPHVLFCDYEESGLIGARDAIQLLDTPEVNVLVDLDRRGSRDYVTYTSNSDEANEYFEKFGFIKANGSVSDLSVLMPEWEIAGANLSVGYMRAHSTSETLHLKHWLNTVDKLEEIMQNPPEERIPYEATMYNSTVYKGTYGNNGSTWGKGWEETEEGYVRYVGDGTGNFTQVGGRKTVPTTPAKKKAVPIKKTEEKEKKPTTSKVVTSPVTTFLLDHKGGYMSYRTAIYATSLHDNYPYISESNWQHVMKSLEEDLETFIKAQVEEYLLEWAEVYQQLDAEYQVELKKKEKELGTTKEGAK